MLQKHEEWQRIEKVSLTPAEKAPYNSYCIIAKECIFMQKKEIHSENTEVRTENKMGYAPISKLIFSISLPIMISMLV